jgi:hypothetical protein
MKAGQSRLLAFPAELRHMIALVPCQKRSYSKTNIQCKARRPTSIDQISHEPARETTAPINAAIVRSPEVEQQLYSVANDIALYYAESFRFCWQSYL